MFVVKRFALWLALSSSIALAACGSDDSGDDGAPNDGGVVELDGGDGGDAGSSTLTVDFTATGCDTFDGGAKPRCKGSAPLRTQLVPVTSANAVTFAWDFGDGSKPDSTRSPTHVYTLPGTYTVTLTVQGEGRVGSLTRTHEAFVVVDSVAVGRPCDVDAQCKSELSCLCSAGASDCPDAFTRGVCTAPCDEDRDCPSGAVCVDLAESAKLDSDAALQSWRRAVCLDECVDNQACAPGLTCRELPTPPASATPWRYACFNDYPRRIGESCVALDGSWDHTSCVTGECWDAGAAGLCSAAFASCQVATCPSGTACAQFVNGTVRCLAGCAVASTSTLSSAVTCDGDPLLACVSPGGTGDWSFVATNGAANALYCAPRKCSNDDDCGLRGVCPSGPSGGHCVRR